MIVASDDARVGRFLASSAHPLDDLLLFADATPPLSRLSRLALVEANGLTALAFAFPLHPECPALGVKGASAAACAAALAQVSADLTAGFVICESAQLPFYAAQGTIGTRHREAHMTLDARAWSPRAITGVRRARLDELEVFYAEHGAAAWHPVQFETGPYFVAEEHGRIVAAAGTHFRTPAAAQLGNVLTAEKFRGQGHAGRCTAAVAQVLVASGAPTLSLFVAEGNPAGRLYESLGFRRHRWLEAFRWERDSLSD